ncbi:MAG: alpha-amylase family glycosyl hydrolase [Sumerlaeia bacterium]
MKRKARLAPVTTSLILCLSVGLQAQSQPVLNAVESISKAEERTPATVDSFPITWSKTQRPTTPGVVRLVPGQSVTLPVSFYLPGGAELQNFTVSPELGLQLTQLPGGYATIEATAEAAGLYIVQSTTGGELSFPVYVDVLPLVSFTYTPANGVIPSTVFAAGDFNGWSQNAHPLTAGEDGVFRASVAVKPGQYSYKLVVDGEWIADPANPVQDSTGYGNSILRVEGDVAQTIDLNYLSPVLLASEASSSQGKIVTNLPPEDPILPERTFVFYGNETVPIATDQSTTANPSWSLADSGTSLQLSIPALISTPGNWVVVATQSESGKIGLTQFPLYVEGFGRLPEDEVIYFAFTDRFANGDKSNDPQFSEEIEKVAPLARYQGGDWAGISQKIGAGYFDNLGVTTLWLSPVTENTMQVEKETVEPGDYFTSYHGYWPTSSTKPNLAFGTMDELRTLVASGRESGIAVILDFVANHVHVNHPWLQQNPQWATIYDLPDGKKNLRLWNEQPYTTWFDSFIPSLDYEKYPEITAKQVEIANYWMNETGVAGFRHDAVKHIAPQFWKSVTTELRKRPGYVLQIGETISDRETIARFVGPDKMSGQFDFPLYFTLRSILAQGGGEMADLANATLDSYRIYEPYAVMSPLLGNHDVSRFMAYADGDLPQGADEGALGREGKIKVDDAKNYEKLKLGFAYLFALPGPPTLYYGDEIGLTGASDPDNRRPMVWEGWSAEQMKLHDAVAQLGQFRTASAALRRGSLEVLSSGKEHIVLARSTADQVVISAFLRSGSAEPLYIELPKAWNLETLMLTNMVEGGASLDQGEGDTLLLSGASNTYGYWLITKR